MKYVFPFKEKFYIYKIFNNVNNKIYIGRTKNPSYRKRQHITQVSKLDQEQKLYIAMRSIGIENFTMEVFEECETYWEACEREIFWINHYISDDDEFGYNDKCGMAGNPILSTEDYDKLSLKMRGSNNPMFGKRKSPEELKEMSIKFSGSGNPFFGKHHSDNAKQLIGNSASLRNSGENNANAKLNLEEVLKIREDWKTGNYTKAALAKKYNVTAATIGNIISGKTWK